ncbi:MAG TPA: amidohydrolase family protein [Caulobacteraceae bacterium]|jgi:N-acyl-D-amino-acid deacylase|nr:amidohydrolase family protein [Caulobacteraceae bacterium]
MPLVRPLALLASAVLLMGAAPAPKHVHPSAPYDLVIRNGRVLDGTGSPWVIADVAIKNGRFVKIGKVDGRGLREIDAQGDYVTPGWIDSMDQSGEVLPINGKAENKVFEGVTTVMAGEGGSPANADKLDAWFTALQKKGISVNFGTYYGACQARMEVMGDKDGRPTPAQEAEQRRRVAVAMRAGAEGIATALIYPPCSFQNTDELVDLAKVAKAYGGIYASHMRDESGDLLKAMDESIEIGEKSGIEVEIFHFKAAYAPEWGKLMNQAVAKVDDARARGVNIAADMYVYTAGGTGLSITVPNWVFADGEKKAIERLRDPKVREKLKQEVTAGSEPGWSNLVQASGGWDHIVLANAYNAKWDKYRYKSIAYIAEQVHEDPADVCWDIVLDALPHRAMGLFFMIDERDIETALKQPWVSIGSDAGASVRFGEIDATGLPHPRAYGNFPRVIAEYVKRRHVITLPDAIRKMTGWPAARLKLWDRGVIREGLRADVTIFNYDRIDDTPSYEHPLAMPAGIDWVIVNGTLVADHGKHTGALPGMVLRGPGYKPH